MRELKMTNTDRNEIYKSILREELLPAMGCTEPIAISYAAAILTHALGASPVSMVVRLSGNIIKNVKSVIVPATGGRHGIETAIVAGLVSASPEKKLEVLTVLTVEDEKKIDELLSMCEIKIEKLTTGCTFELCLAGECDGDVAEVKFSGAHTNVTHVSKNKIDVTSKYKNKCTVGDRDELDLSARSVEEIVEFADTIDLSELAPYLENQIKLISEAAVITFIQKHGKTLSVN
jgi:L-cysteine desulfidase